MSDITAKATEIFESLEFNMPTTLGTCARHVFPNGWGVSVLRLGRNHFTHGYNHGYEVMLTHDGSLCHGGDTPLTHGDSVPFNAAWEVIEFLEMVHDLDPKPIDDDTEDTPE